MVFTKNNQVTHTCIPVPGSTNAAAAAVAAVFGFSLSSQFRSVYSSLGRGYPKRNL